MAQATNTPNTKSAQKTATTDVERSTPIDEFLAGTADTATKTDRPKVLEDFMIELRTGAELLIDRLEKAFDAGLGLEIDVGADVMDQIIAAQWIASRLSDDLNTVRREFRHVVDRAAE